MFLRTDQIDYSRQRFQGRRGNPRKQLRLTPGFGNVAPPRDASWHIRCAALSSCRSLLHGPQKTDWNILRPRIELYLCAFATGWKLFSVEECAMKFIVNGSALRKLVLVSLV